MSSVDLSHDNMVTPFPASPTARDELARNRRMAQLAAEISRQADAERAERARTVMEAARRAGEAVGERRGYVQGWWWGVVCGAVAGSLIVAIAVRVGYSWAHLLSL